LVDRSLVNAMEFLQLGQQVLAIDALATPQLTKSKGSGLIGGTFGACYISLHAQT
jgi:hypothetical protein